MPYLTGSNILNSNKNEIEEETQKSIDIINKREKQIQDSFEYQSQNNLQNYLYVNFFCYPAKVKTTSHNANPDNLIDNKEI